MPYQDYSVTMTLPAVREQDVAPVALPTAEPGAGSEQISYTVAAGDLPTFVGTYKSMAWSAGIFGGGQNTDGVARAVYWRTKKNGVAVGTGNTSVSNNYYYTVNAWVLDVVVGDVITLSLWCPASLGAVNYIWDGFRVSPTRLYLCDNDVLSKYYWSACNVLESTFVLGVSPSVGGSYSNKFFSGGANVGLGFLSSETLGVGQHHETYGLMRASYGDINYANYAVVRTSATLMPYTFRNYYSLTYSVRRHLRTPMGVYLP
jgi:hypothetical protein